MNIGLLKILHTKVWDFRPDMAQTYANALKNAIELQVDGADLEKQHGYFLSTRRGFEDKLYVGNIHRIENHLYYNDEELADDDQIVNVVVVDGPVTRDGGACSYGSKEHRDQILYANTIPQVVGHIFIINTPGGEAAARIDYEQAIDDCREKGKPTVAWVDGMCCSAGVNLASRCDRTIVMNGKDDFGCIGTMAAFWATAHGTVDQDGSRYVELVGSQSPEKNAWYREAAAGEYEKLQEELDRCTEEFHRSVRENRPLVTADMLTGKVFEAREVMPALVDEIGGYDRAIEAVFELADGTMPAARTVMEEPKEEEGGEEHEGQKDLASLNGQQKAAVATGAGETMIVDDGHVSTVVDGMFGPEEVEVAEPSTRKNDNDMKQEEIINTETAEQTEEVIEAPVTEEAPAQEETTVQEEQEAPAEEAPAEETPAEEEAPAEEAPAEEAPEEETPAEEEPAGEPAAGETPAEDAPAAGEAPAGEQEAQGDMEGNAHTLEAGNANTVSQSDITHITVTAGEAPGTIAAESDTDKIQATLKNAEDLVEKKDREIDNLKADKDTLNGLVARQEETINEMRGTIEKLQKQVADLKAEVKELAGKPAPMVDAAAGVPAGNGTGDAPKVNSHQRIRRGMSYEEIRKIKKSSQP